MLLAARWVGVCGLVTNWQNGTRDGNSENRRGKKKKRSPTQQDKNEKKRITRLWTGCAVLETSCDRTSYAVQYRVSSVIYLPFFPSVEVIWGCHWSASSRVQGEREGCDMGWILEDRARALRPSMQPGNRNAMWGDAKVEPSLSEKPGYSDRGALVWWVC